jgi:hypothetical protein
MTKTKEVFIQNGKICGLLGNSENFYLARFIPIQKKDKCMFCDSTEHLHKVSNFNICGECVYHAEMMEGVYDEN